MRKMKGYNKKDYQPRLLNCDQVSWILQGLERYLKIATIHKAYPRITRIPEMASYAFILELCEYLNMELDKDSAFNILPEEIRSKYLLIKKEATPEDRG